MKTSLLTLTLLASTPALADSDALFDRSMPAARSGLEIAIGGGYTQGFGTTGAGPDVGDLAGPGGTAELHLGYRIIPSLTIGAYGTLEAFSDGSMVNGRTDVGGASLGFKGDWHLRPTRSVDPWISIGTGVRYLATDDRGTTSKLRGLDLARVQVGVDYRVSRGFALTPAIGATATMYVEHDASMTSGYREIDGKEISWTLGASLLGRFNVGL